MKDEIAEILFDAHIRALTGMPGEEFVRRYNAGDLPSYPPDTEESKNLSLAKLIVPVLMKHRLQQNEQQ